MYLRLHCTKKSTKFYLITHTHPLIIWITFVHKLVEQIKVNGYGWRFIFKIVPSIIMIHTVNKPRFHNASCIFPTHTRPRAHTHHMTIPTRVDKANDNFPLPDLLVGLFRLRQACTLDKHACQTSMHVRPWLLHGGSPSRMNPSDATFGNDESNAHLGEGGAEFLSPPNPPPPQESPKLKCILRSTVDKLFFSQRLTITASKRQTLFAGSIESQISRNRFTLNRSTP